MKHYDVDNPKPEFLIGLAAPVGSDLRRVSKLISQELRAYEYHSIHFRVSDLLKEWCSNDVKDVIKNAKEECRINYLMNVGDLLRREARSGAALISLLTSAIRIQRQKTLLSEGCERDIEEVELYNYCYIIDSLKNPSEVEVLRKIYGSKFIMVSVVSPEETRKQALMAKIAKSHNRTDDQEFEEASDRLIRKDRERSDVVQGQNISGTFHLADFFLRASKDFLESDIRRLLNIVFGRPDVTPTRNEFVMFEAKSNALRSGDLSRQVGAVITNRKLEIISRGCNEVPVPGGDTFWPDDDGVTDSRDYAAGKDFNAVKKVEILGELLDFLVDHDVFKVSLANNLPAGGRASERIIEDLISGSNKGRFKNLRISNLIEFGRMVHAEMFALMEAARRGLSVQDGTLYCTTFPCHMCARHIIASGIREVVYIEPYPKSMTKDLYGDMIKIECVPEEVISSRASDRPAKVYFQPFSGVAPRFFANAFGMTRRKDDKGYALPFDEQRSLPKRIPLSKSHLSLEAAFASTLSEIPVVTDVTAVIEAAK